MSSEPAEQAPVYHLLLDLDEVPVTASALRLMLADEAHEPTIRRLAREVLAQLEEPADSRGVLTLSLAAQQMKITHGAVRLLLNDLSREQADERRLLWGIIEKLPDEHVMRAITID